MKILIVGGSSGLGLELARQMAAQKHEIIVTGRKDPKVDFAEFRMFDLSAPHLAGRVKSFIDDLPKVDLLVYTAGFYQEGRVTDLSYEAIEHMLDVGGRGLIYMVRALLARQDHLDELITITSSSQWTPRQKEPVYNFVKAAAGHFSNALAEDGRIGKVMVAGPAGMNTPFWEGIERDDYDKMLDPVWVATQIISENKGMFRYKYIRLLRQPARVEVEETR